MSNLKSGAELREGLVPREHDPLCAAHFGAKCVCGANDEADAEETEEETDEEAWNTGLEGLSGSEQLEILSARAERYWMQRDNLGGEIEHLCTAFEQVRDFAHSALSGTSHDANLRHYEEVAAKAISHARQIVEDNRDTANQAKKDIRQRISAAHLSFAKLSARSVSFSDLARGRIVAVTVRGFTGGTKCNGTY